MYEALLGRGVAQHVQLDKTHIPMALALQAAGSPVIIVIGSLAAAYHLFAEREDGQVRTKDIDRILVPRVEAVRAGKAVADALLAAGWRRRTEGPHAAPGTARTPDNDLPVVRRVGGGGKRRRDQRGSLPGEFTQHDGFRA